MLRLFFYELIFLIFLEVWNHSADDGPHQLEDTQMQDAQVGQIAHQGEQGYQCVTGNQCNHLNQNSLVDGSFGSEAIQDGGDHHAAGADESDFGWRACLLYTSKIMIGLWIISQLLSYLAYIREDDYASLIEKLIVYGIQIAVLFLFLFLLQQYSRKASLLSPGHSPQENSVFSQK